MLVSHADFIDLDPEPILRFTIKGAPHKRFLDKYPIITREYRKQLLEACEEVGIRTPIERPIKLSAHFVDPTGPDLDNLLTALFRALDGRSRHGVLADDELIHSLGAVDKMFNR